MKGIFVLGATGSIGKSFFSLLNSFPEIKPVGIHAHRNEKKVVFLKKKYNIKYAFLTGKKPESKEIIYGEDNLKEFVLSENVKKVLWGASGVQLYRIFFELLKNNKIICMANKEIIIAFGELIGNKRKNIIPVDSEHSSIFRIMNILNKKEIDKIYLTASGGPFFDKPKKELQKVTFKQALSHPTWKMGRKITIDSATLINKGFEVIEAHYLFDFPVEKIEVVRHPESIVHGICELKDGTYFMHMGKTDMRIPILYALFYPEVCLKFKEPLDIKREFKFERIPNSRRKLIDLCYRALKEKKGKPALIVGADEVLVEYFLKGRIRFLDIEKILLKVYNNSPDFNDRTFEGIEKALYYGMEKAKEEIN